jgi:hypothetical protein
MKSNENSSSSQPGESPEPLTSTPPAGAPESVDRQQSSGAVELGSPSAIDMDQQTMGEAFQNLKRMLHRSVGVPESLRSASAYASEWVRESANWLVPSAFRNSRSYSIFVRQMLDYVVNDLSIGGRLHGSDQELTDHDQVILARKTMGGLLDITALATFHLSPLTVMAIFGDLAYGNKDYLQYLADRLVEQRLLPASASIQCPEALVDAVQQALGGAVTVFEQPPISIHGLRKTIQDTRETLLHVDPNHLFPPSEIDQFLRQMELAARAQGASIWDVSATISVVAVGNIQLVSQGGVASLDIAGNMYQQKIIDYYWEGLRAVERQGLITALSRSSEPYLETVWNNYSMDQKTWKEQLLSGELFKWGWSRFNWPKLGRFS